MQHCYRVVMVVLVGGCSGFEAPFVARHEVTRRGGPRVARRPRVAPSVDPTRDKKRRLFVAGSLLATLSSAECLSEECWLAAAMAVGIPHGAVDHRLHAIVHDEAAWPSPCFCSYYVGVMAAYGMLWATSPQLALALFVAMASFHFGETQMLYLPDSPWTPPAQTLWGLGVLAGLLLPHWDETVAVLDAFGVRDVPHCDPTLALGLGPLWLATSLMTGVDRKLLVDEVLETALLAILLVQAPMLIGFAYFFIFWHTLPSIKHQIIGFQKYVDATFDSGDYLREALPYSIPPFTALLVTSATHTNAADGVSSDALLSGDSAALAATAFIGVALLTAPHVALISEFQHKVFAPSDTTPVRISPSDDSPTFRRAS